MPPWLKLPFRVPQVGREPGAPPRPGHPEGAGFGGKEGGG